MLPLSWRELLGSKVSDFILWLVFSASFSSIWKEAKENGFQFYATKTQNRWKKTSSLAIFQLHLLLFVTCEVRGLWSILTCKLIK